MLKKKILEHNGIFLTARTLLHVDLTGNEKILLEIICNLYTYDECDLKNEELAEFFHLKPRRITGMISKLRRLNLIRLEGSGCRRTIFPVL